MFFRKTALTSYDASEKPAQDYSSGFNSGDRDAGMNVRYKENVQRLLSGERGRA